MEHGEFAGYAMRNKHFADNMAHNLAFIGHFETLGLNVVQPSLEEYYEELDGAIDRKVDEILGNL